jgi:general secretion pathway protein G
MKTRKGGFTLVELLIVIMIIAILSGMMMLSTGSATDLAETVKVINDLRVLKSAALLYFVDHLEWPTDSEAASLDNYSDRPIVTANPPRYADIVIGTEFTDARGITRTNIGVALITTSGNGSAGVRKKLALKAIDAGLLGVANNSTTPYASTGTVVYMNMR